MDDLALRASGFAEREINAGKRLFPRRIEWPEDVPRRSAEAHQA
jgi:hypothetical protein